MTARPIALTLAAALMVTGCGPGTAAGDDEPRETLTIFAAASLRDVFDQLGSRWEAAHPTVELVNAFDGSNILATQIAEGAPADVFVSADRTRPEQLAAAGHTAAAPVSFARNRVALVAAARASALQRPADLAQPGLRIVAAGRGVPISEYAEATLRSLAGSMTGDPDFLVRVESNIVSREDNVRAALAKVELGEADAAFVYETDARTSGSVRRIELDEGIAAEAEFAAVQVTDRPVAARFVEWLRGPEAGAILAAAGFEPIEP